jgi:hypothetical protein
MKNALKTCIVVMVILTAVYIGLIVYANANSSYNTNSNSYGKKPIEYGILKSYFGERLETEPQEWNTTGELGIIFGDKVEPAETESYLILIVDEEKALPWMNGTIPEPYAVKYADNFYHIVFLWIDLGLPESIKQWQVPLTVMLGAGWIFTGLLFLKERKKG